MIGLDKVDSHTKKVGKQERRVSWKETLVTVKEIPDRPQTRKRKRMD
jgi:hypothetical protein